MLPKMFTDHPASVGETYFQHLSHATFFSTRMILGGFACLIHGLLPFLFTKSGSNTIRFLHQRMVSQRRGDTAATAAQAGGAPTSGSTQ